MRDDRELRSDDSVALSFSRPLPPANVEHSNDSETAASTGDVRCLPASGWQAIHGKFEGGARVSNDGVAAGAGEDSTDAEFSLAQMAYIFDQATAAMQAKDPQLGDVAHRWAARWLRQWSRDDHGDAPVFSRVGVRYWLNVFANNVRSSADTGIDVFTCPSSSNPI